MHLCCESTRFEHRVIVDRGANETCPRSAGVRSAAHVAARSASSTMRAIVSRVRDALRRHFRTKFPFKDRHFPIRAEFCFLRFLSMSRGRTRSVARTVRARGQRVRAACSVLAASL